MYLLKEGRGSFLEFLRNLTPQALILTMAFLVGIKLDFHHSDIGNTFQTSVFFFFVVTWLISVYANTSLLIENACGSIGAINAKSKELIENRVSKLRWALELGRFTWRNQKVFFIEVLLAIAIAEGGIAAAFVLAMSSAARTLQVFS